MKGFALVEVLIALLILSIGLIGIAGMQLSSLQHSQEAYLHSLASTQLFSMFERLRANKSPAMREREYLQWNIINAQLLPRGQGNYHCDGDICTIVLQWVSKQLQSISVTANL